MDRYGEAQGWIGAGVRRKEDARLLTGAGSYVDDWAAPDALHLAVLRSPHAHARLRRLDLAAARSMPGVIAVVDGATVRQHLGPMPTADRKVADTARLTASDPGAVPTLRLETQLLVATDKVRFVGEAVALVVAESRYAAEDAAERIAVDYEPLSPVVDVEAASQPDAPLLHEAFDDNLSLRLRVGAGDIDAAFEQADRRVRRRFRMHRLTGVPIETRGVLARPEPDGGLTVWAATQMVHVSRDSLAAYLHLSPAQIRVIAQDVGGGFGIKSGVYPELVLVAWLALRQGRPVKWIEDRFEHLHSATQARDQVHDVELALREDGTILGLRDRFTVDAGAYNPHGVGQPYNTASHLVGPYRVPAVDIEAAVWFSNKSHFAPYRGAGRPEAVFVMDRVLDCAAHELGLDPADLRRRNLINPAEMPYDTGLVGRDGQHIVYDSGDYPACFTEALRLVDYETVRREQPALWARGVYRGVGLSAYVESTGSGPFEGASVGIDDTGHVWVYTGACSQGQSHETTFAQVCAERLGVAFEQVTVVTGDTDVIARGEGTRSSRLGVVAGSAVAQASQAVGERLRALAAGLLEADAHDLELRDGAARVRGVPDRAVTFAELAALAASRNVDHPSAAANGDEPSPRGKPSLSVRETRYFQPPTFTYANAVQAAVVEVDVETGNVQLLKCAVVHDCGRVINPLVADGQICGGVAQGIGNALMEELVFDESGQLLSGSLMDYLLPTSCDVPPIALAHVESPTPRNPIGAKGLGEGGVIAPPAAIANAVEDALRPLGVEVTTTPLTPERVLALIEAASSRTPGSSG